MKTGATIQKCSECGWKEEEGWPTHYIRVVSARNPKPFLCRQCKPKKVKRISSHPISISWLQRKFKLSYQEAEKLLNDKANSKV